MSKAKKSAPSSSGSRARSDSTLAVVGFDTATPDTAAGAWRDGEVLHESLLGPADGGPRHTTALLAEVERAAAAAGGWERVELLAVGLGPGSFTGLRIGIATGRGLAASLGLPLTGVCTLDALGRGMEEAGLPGAHLAVFDARRGEVFAALYAESGERRWEPFVCPPEQLLERVAALPAPPSAAGSGAVRFRHDLSQYGVRIEGDDNPVHRVAARHICALAATAGEGVQVAPIYLRPPDAERWRERDSFQRDQ